MPYTFKQEDYNYNDQKLRPSAQQWFSKAVEEKFKSNVVVRYVAGEVSPAVHDRESIMIFDFATPYPANIREDEGIYSDTFSSGVLPFKVHSRWTFEPGSLETLSWHDYSLGMYAYKTIWFNVQLANFTASHFESMFSSPEFKEMLEHINDAEYFKDTAERKRVKTERFIKNYLKNASEVELAQSRLTLKERITEITMLERKLINASTNLEKAAHRVKYNEDYISQQGKNLQRQIDTLYENVNYKEILTEAPRKQLVVKTNLIYLYSPDKTERVPLGEMKIAYGLADHVIKITNLTNKRGDRHHPHVEDNGTPCWGGLTAIIAKLTSQGELVGLFETIVMFLEKYSPTDDWGRFGSYFFDDETEYLQADGSYGKDKTVAKLDMKMQQEEVEAVLSDLGVVE